MPQLPYAPPPSSANPDEQTDGGTLLRERKEARPPSLYKVLMLNDDYTPMEFVVSLLQSLFRMEHSRAVEVMLQVHHKGIGLCGVFPFEIADTKARQVIELARQSEHPLQCLVEKEGA